MQITIDSHDLAHTLAIERLKLDWFDPFDGFGEVRKEAMPDYDHYFDVYLKLIENSVN